MNFAVADADMFAAAEPAATAQFPDEHVSQLMGLGFTREQAIEGLAVSNGNPEAAASYLLSMQS